MPPIPPSSRPPAPVRDGDRRRPETDGGLELRGLLNLAQCVETGANRASKCASHFKIMNMLNPRLAPNNDSGLPSSPTMLVRSPSDLSGMIPTPIPRSPRTRQELSAARACVPALRPAGRAARPRRRKLRSGCAPAALPRLSALTLLSLADAVSVVELIADAEGAARICM